MFKFLCNLFKKKKLRDPSTTEPIDCTPKQPTIEVVDCGPMRSAMEVLANPPKLFDESLSEEGKYCAEVIDSIRKSLNVTEILIKNKDTVLAIEQSLLLLQDTNHKLIQNILTKNITNLFELNPSNDEREIINLFIKECNEKKQDAKTLNELLMEVAQESQFKSKEEIESDIAKEIADEQIAFVDFVSNKSSKNKPVKKPSVRRQTKKDILTSAAKKVADIKAVSTKKIVKQTTKRPTKKTSKKKK